MAIPMEDADFCALHLLSVHRPAAVYVRPYPALQTALHLLGRNDIYIGTVEGWPGLEEILRQLEPGGARRIDLLPLMLVAGDRARNDMAVEWKSRLEGMGHTVVCSFTGLGELPWVQEMYRERPEKLL